MTIPSPANIVRWLTITTCCTPLLYTTALQNNFQAPTFLAFCALVALTLPFYLAWVSQNRSLLPFKNNPIFLALILYLAVRILSALFGVDPWNSFFGSETRIGGLILQLHLFLFTLYLFALLKFDQKKFFQSLSTLFVGLASLVSLHGILEYFDILPAVVQGFADRSSSVFGNPTFFASFLVLPFFLALTRAFSSSVLKEKRLFQGTAILILIGCLTTGTRGAILAMLIGGILALILKGIFATKKEARKHILVGSLLVGILFVGLFGVLRSQAQAETELYRFTHLFTDTGTERLVYWNMALEGWKEHPLLGNGYENFYETSTSHFDPAIYAFSAFWIDKPHNAFFEMLSTGGLLSLFGYLILIGLMLFAFSKSYIQDKHSSTPFLLIGAIVAYLAQAFFLFDVLDSQIPFFFLVAYAATLLEQNPTHQNSSPFSKQSGPPLILGGVATLLLITFLYFPMASDLVYASSSTNAAIDKNWEQALETSTKIGSSWFVFDQHIAARNRYDLLQRAMATGVTTGSIYTELFRLTYEAQKATIAWHPKRTEYINELIGTLIFEARLTEKPVSASAHVLAQQSIQLAPKRIESLFLLSQVYQQNNEWESAIETLEQATQIAPKNMLALGTLGILYFETGEREKGAALIRSALEQDFQFIPSYLNVVSLLSNYYAEIDDWDANISLFTLAIESLPYNFDFYTTLATSYHRAGDDVGARRVAEELLAIDPSTEEGVQAFLETLAPQNE